MVNFINFILVENYFTKIENISCFIKCTNDLTNVIGEKIC